MTLIKQYERFWKKFANVPLRAANVIFTKSNLQFCIGQARAIWQRGRLEELFLKALFKCAPTNTRKNQCAKKTSRLFKGDS